MESLMIFGAVLALLAAFDIVVLSFGRDSRDGEDWLVHRQQR